jgi:hypothetical protein
MNRDNNGKRPPSLDIRNFFGKFLPEIFSGFAGVEAISRLPDLVYVNQTTLRAEEDDSKAITNFLCCYQFADKNEKFRSSHSCLSSFTSY